MKRTLATVFLCLLLAPPAWAGYYEGVTAYYRGDFETTLREFRPLTEQDIAIAQYNLGVMYHKGQGVPQDYAKAMKWYRKAAEQGYHWGQNNLGTMYDKGQGVPQDYAEAARWYRKAAEQGNATGQYNLGYVYHLGQGVSQNYVQAHKWFYLAATKGNKKAVIWRDLVAKKMTPAQIAKAQKFAREWSAAFKKRKGK